MRTFRELMTERTADLLPESKVIGVSGSPRKNGNSDVLMRKVLEGVDAENVESISIQLRDIQFQGCVGCEKCRKDGICTGLHDGLSMMYSEIITSKGLVLVSPTHNYNITSWMKAFVDRLYCFYQFEGARPGAWSSRLANQRRGAVLVAICEQENSEDMGYTLDAMQAPIEALGYQVIGALKVFRTFKRGMVSDDPESLEKAFTLGRNLARSLMLEGSS